MVLSDNILTQTQHLYLLKQRGMIKTLSALYTSSHYTDIYIRYADTDILINITDQETRGFIQIK
jgi:hypothetical protein